MTVLNFKIKKYISFSFKIYSPRILTFQMGEVTKVLTSKVTKTELIK